MQDSRRIVYLMRGLPSCGKSYTARALVRDGGVICETDAYFYSQVGSDPARFDYRPELMEAAREWNLQRFSDALRGGVTPIVVDRGNSLSADSQIYVRLAREHDYLMVLQEPQSPWWTVIRTMLANKSRYMPQLEQWAARLSQMNQATHRVPKQEILRRMKAWKCDLTVDDIANYRPTGGAIAKVVD